MARWMAAVVVLAGLAGCGGLGERPIAGIYDNEGVFTSQVGSLPVINEGAEARPRVFPVPGLRE